MGYRILKVDNLYTVWSTIVDNVIVNFTDLESIKVILNCNDNDFECLKNKIEVFDDLSFKYYYLYILYSTMSKEENNDPLYYERKEKEIFSDEFILTKGKFIDLINKTIK